MSGFSTEEKEIWGMRNGIAFVSLFCSITVKAEMISVPPACQVVLDCTILKLLLIVISFSILPCMSPEHFVEAAKHRVYSATNITMYCFTGPSFVYCKSHEIAVWPWES